MAREIQKRKQIGSELRTLLFYFILLTLVYSRFFVYTPMPVGQTILSVLVFMILAATFLLLFNAPLIKLLVARPDSVRIRLAVIAVAALIVMTVLYAALVRPFHIHVLLYTCLFAGLPPAMAAILKKESPGANVLLGVFLFGLWFLLFRGMTPAVTIPPVQAKLHVLLLDFTISLVLAFVLIRGQALQGMVFHFKGADWRSVIHYTMIGILAILIAGFAAQSLAPSSRIPGFLSLVSGFAGFYFFVALPEEILFRSVFVRLYEKYLSSMWIVAGVSALLYGVLHAWEANPVHIGLLPAPGGDPFSLMNIVLATIAGFVYALVYVKTRKVTASALTHAIVGWVWAMFFAG